MKIKSQVYKTRNSAVGHDLGSGVERKAPPLEYPGPSTRAPGPGVPRRVLSLPRIKPGQYCYTICLFLFMDAIGSFSPKYDLLFIRGHLHCS